jgi:hypothetical protein
MLMKLLAPLLPVTVSQALGALSGRWKLVYTSSTQTLLLLNALDALPLVDIGDVYQVCGKASCRYARCCMLDMYSSSQAPA